MGQNVNNSNLIYACPKLFLAKSYGADKTSLNLVFSLVKMRILDILLTIIRIKKLCVMSITCDVDHILCYLLMVTCFMGYHKHGLWVIIIGFNVALEGRNLSNNIQGPW